MTTYALGATARLTGTFRDDQETLANPAGVFLRLLRPNGVITDHEFGVDVDVMQLSTGIYSFDVVLNQEGRWRYRWEAAGSNVTAAEGTFDVDASEFA